MSANYKPGNRLRLTADGRLVVIWSQAPGAGNYWAHVGEGPDRPVLLVRVTHPHNSLTPLVTLVEE